MIVPIERRGLSDAYGSWKIIWTSRRSGRSLCSDHRADVLAVVDDGSARRREQARQQPRRRRLAAAALADEAERLAALHVERDAVDGMHARDFALQQALSDREVLDEVVDGDEALVYRSTGCSCCSDCHTRLLSSTGRWQPNEVPRLGGRELGLGLERRRRRIRTARMELATARRVDEARRRPRDRAQPLGARRVETRDRLQEPPRVRMLRLREQHLARRLLEHAARVHDGDVVAHLRDHAEIVRDEDDRGPEVVAQRLDELQHLRLHRHVERRRRLVGDEDVGAERKRHRDHRALAHAARHLVREASRSAPPGSGCRPSATPRSSACARRRAGCPRARGSPRRSGGRP